MNIKYNETNKSIEIKDGIKTHYYVLKIVIGLNLFTAFLNLYNTKDTGFGFIKVLWLVIAIAMLGYLYYFLFKKSDLDSIPVAHIKRLKEKTVIGKKRYSLELINGKSRDLNEIKTKKDFDEIQNVFQEVGVII